MPPIRVVLVLLLALAAGPLAAQSAPVRPAPPAWSLAAGGAAGGVVGFAAGSLLGAPFNADHCSDCNGTLVGGLAGLSVGTPLGVHLADGRRGNVWAVLGGSAAAGLGASLLAAELGADGTAVQVSLPAAQLLSAVAIEMFTRRR